MKLIGLTGRSGSGKGVVCRIFSETHDIPSIDCDKLSRSVCGVGMPCTKELADFFGSEILDENGALRRRVLASIAFGDKKKTERLNRITHKYILAACLEEIKRYEANGVRALILDAPTLFESGLHLRCDAIIAVLADDEICIDRIQKRDKISRAEAKKRLDSQPNAEFYLANCNYIVYNNISSPLTAQINEIVRSLFSED